MINSAYTPIVVIKGKTAKQMQKSLTSKTKVNEEKARQIAHERLKKAGFFG